MYGKIVNEILITPSAIELERGQFITNPTAEQYIVNGFKEVVYGERINKPCIAVYSESETQIVVSYKEVEEK